MGGPGGVFLTTRWSLIDRVGQGGDTPDHVLINDLIKHYWKPVYCFLRRKGYDNEQAKDLTQGFFTEVVVGRDLIKYADAARGRFRTFLLSALTQYLSGVHRRENAQKRIPKNKLSSLDHLAGIEPSAPADHMTPEQSFHYAWVTELLDKLLTEVEDRCREDGKAKHWQVFHDRVLGPILESTTAPSLTELARIHGIDDPKTVSNMIITVNRRFQAALKRMLRRSVTQNDQIDEELRELRKMLGVSLA
jgi:RNA polymerase sigma-70 factor (ECF subfamily)